MQDGQERRAQGMKRVPVEALVEICGRESGGAPPFEAESVDVSGRGMHVRTAYLPEVGAPLVCRFEDEGREIVVEGAVAWNSPAERGGEFGIRFTALDSGSVDALRDLCAREITRAESEAAPPVEEPSAAHEAPEVPDEPDAPAPGSRVRLHIDGLGAPMKASVREGTTRRMHVASNLEFLKVGRTLQLEGGAGGRRPAKIHAVDVMVDPSTQVPQLVVSLKFQDVDELTPEPSVIDSAVTVTPRSPQVPLDTAVAALDAGVASTEEDYDLDEPGPEPGEAPAEFADADDDDIVDDAGLFSTRMSRAATVAGAQAKRAGETAAHLGAAAGKGMGRLFKGASEKLGEYRKSKADDKDRPRRTTAPPPSGTLSSNGRTLRRQTGDVRAEAPQVDAASKVGGVMKSKKGKKIAGAAALVLLVTTVSVIAMKKPASPPGANVEVPAASKTVAAESPAGDVTQVDDQGNPVAAQPASPAAPAPLKAQAAEPGGITADVPLFGPTPMATMEPAPLGPPPELGAPSAGGAQSEEEKEKAAANAAVDEKFKDGDKKSTKKKAKANPSSVKPWGRGRVRTPTIHRLRLDQPGGAIKGAKNPTGFTVVVPGVKVMESARGIQKRDSRIARVRTRNGSYGAEITFQFRNSVPGYRVRLRKDYVEFLISAPAKSGISSSKSKTKSKK